LSGYTVYYSGTEDRSVHGVSLMVSNRINNTVMVYDAFDERIISINALLTMQY